MSDEGTSTNLGIPRLLQTVALSPSPVPLNRDGGVFRIGGLLVRPYTFMIGDPWVHVIFFWKVNFFKSLSDILHCRIEEIVPDPFFFSVDVGEGHSRGTGRR